MKSIYRPYKTKKQKDARRNLVHNLFKKQIFYKIIKSNVFWPFLWILKKIFQKHDTLASNKNIPKNLTFAPFWTIREAYSNAFEIWTKNVLFKQHNRNYLYKDFRKMNYDSWAQKTIRFLLNLACTLELEDTAYRELIAIFGFEYQKIMNSTFNPEIQQKHVIYCSYYDGDPRYFEIQKEIGRVQKAGPKYKEKTKQALKKVNSKYYIGKEKEFFKKYQMKEVTEKVPTESIIAKLPVLTDNETLIISFPEASKKKIEAIWERIKIYAPMGNIILTDTVLSGVLVERLVREDEN